LEYESDTLRGVRHLQVTSKNLLRITQPVHKTPDKVVVLNFTLKVVSTVAGLNAIHVIKKMKGC
jgi:hypothetical protein